MSEFEEVNEELRRLQLAAADRVLALVAEAARAKVLRDAADAAAELAANRRRAGMRAIDGGGDS